MTSRGLGALFILALVAGWGCNFLLTLEECDGDSDCPSDARCTSDGLCEVDSTGEGECSDEEDCAPGEDCVEQVCVSTEEPEVCEDNDECPGDQECNDLGVCQEASSLLAPPCEQAAGDVDDDDAFVIGVLLPLSGPEAGFGQPLFNAINIARSDFNSIGGVDGRDITLLACDTEGQDGLAMEGAQHLVDVGVQAIVGPDYSSQTIDIANNLTIDAEVVLVSPSATAAAVPADPFVWRTVAPDTVQGEALGKLINYIIDERPHYEGLEDGQFPDMSSMALLRRSDDPYAQGLREAVTDQLPSDLTGDSDRFTVRAYANEAAGETPDYPEVAADLVATTDDDGFGPDVIGIIGASEAWQIADFLADEFDNNPLFVFADAARNSERAGDASDSLKGRVWGTAPQNVGDRDYTPYNSFRFRYMEAFPGDDPNDRQFVANAYDALYILALAAAAEGFDGPSIATGLGRLSDPDGPLYAPNPGEAQSAMNDLQGGQNINFRGASGELNFDATGSPQASPTVLWCFDDQGLPERGILVDQNLNFTPQVCDLNP